MFGPIQKGVTISKDWFAEWLSSKTLPPQQVRRRLNVTGDNRTMRLGLAGGFLDANGDYVNGTSIDVDIYAVTPSQDDPTKGTMVKVAGAVSLLPYQPAAPLDLPQGEYVFVVTAVALGGAAKWVILGGTSFP